MNIKPSQYDLLTHLLDVTAIRHKTLAHNVANVNTPGFHRHVVEFEEEFQKQLKKTGKVDFQKVKPEIVEDTTSPERFDGNNVDVDAEMGRLNKNTLLNNTYIQIIATKNAMLKRAINPNG